MTGIGKASEMYQTIHRQPADLRRVLDGGWGVAGQAARRLSAAKRVYVVGIGTSYHAALMGSWLLRYNGIDARAVASFDFAQYPHSYPLGADDAVIVLSHTGAKQYSLAALQVGTNAGAAVMSIGGTEAEHPGSELILRTTQKETSAAYTSSHLVAMTVLAQMAVEAGTGDGATTLKKALMALPEQVQAIINAEEILAPLASVALPRHTYVVGGGPSEVAALEAVIKGREAAYVRIDGMGLEQFLHGPMICLQPDDLVVLINVAGGSRERNLEAAALFAKLGASVWTVGDPLGELPAIEVPQTLEVLSPILTTVPFQLLAYQMATLQQLDPDTFRTQEPRFLEAIEAIAL